MIIDAFAGPVPEPEAFAAADATLARLRGYQEHFARDDEASPARSSAEVERRIEETRSRARPRCPSEDELFAMLDDARIDVAALFTERYVTSLGVHTATNVQLAEFVAKAPDRLVGLGGVDPWEADAARVVDEAANELGLRGVVLSPFKQALDPTDPRLARVYGRCEANGLPIFLHTGINWWLDADYDVGHPRHIDRIAGAFPDLKIVALHAGWPWMTDMVMVAWRHPNVYLDLSAHRPKTFTRPEFGWGPLLYYGNRMLADKVLFASSWTLLGVEPAELVAEVRSLPLEDRVQEKWLGLNAARLFGFDV